MRRNFKVMQREKTLLSRLYIRNTAQTKKVLTKEYISRVFQTVIFFCIFVQRIYTVVLEDFKQVLSKSVGVDNCKYMYINEKGPLNPLRGYLMNETGYISNKRNYSPGIDIYGFSNSITKEVIEEDNLIPELGDNEHIYSNMKNKKLSNYLQEYHFALMKMFPRENSNGNKKGGCIDLMKIFLDQPNVKSHVHHVLASLLLLSEGFNVNISIEDDGSKKMLVLRKACYYEEHFRIKINQVIGPVRSIMDLGVFWTHSADIIRVIEFFINSGKPKENKFIRECGFKEPNSWEEFQEGKFLNSPETLIQAYIFKYIKGPEEIIKFSIVVFNLMKEYMFTTESIRLFKEKRKEKESNPSVVKIFKNISRIHQFKEFKKKVKNQRKAIERIYYKYFTSNLAEKDRAKTVNGLMKFNSILEESKVSRVPFRDSLNRFFEENIDPMKVYNRDISKTDTIKTEYAPSDEAALLCLFCCMAYNPITRKYETSHMGNISKNLKEFFANLESTRPITDEVFTKWQQVINGLDNEEVIYRSSKKNSLMPGILNMLSMIAEVTGKYSEIKESIKYIREMILKQESNESLKKKVGACVNVLFSPIFSKKNFFSQEITNPSEVKERVTYEVKILVENISIARLNRKAPELMGDIHIHFLDENKRKECFTLNFSDLSVTATLTPPKNSFIPMNAERRIANSMDEISSRSNAFTHYLMANYMALKKVETYTTKRYTLKKLNNALKRAMNKDEIQVDGLFLCGNISSLKEKETFIMSMLHYTTSQKITIDNPVVRVILNMLNTENMSDGRTHRKLFPLVLYTNVYQYRTDIENTQSYSGVHLASQIKQALKVCNYMQKMSTPDNLANWLLIYTKIQREDFKNLFQKLISEMSDTERDDFINFITENGKTTDHLDKISNGFKPRRDESEAYMEGNYLDSFWVNCFEMACQTPDKKYKIMIECIDRLIKITDKILIFREFLQLDYLQNVLDGIKSLKMRMGYIDGISKKCNAFLDNYEYLIQKRIDRWNSFGNHK
ncbi:hypothetical protein NEAUS06_2028 [Nematocida ausubeli]|nr:hypothetical protein NEAUS06_2028 [Nematocida ausubeli]